MDDLTHTFSGVVHFSYTYNTDCMHANVQKKARNSKVGSFFGTSWTHFGRIRKPFSRSHEKGKPRRSTHEQRGVSVYFRRFSA